MLEKIKIRGKNQNVRRRMTKKNIYFYYFYLFYYLFVGKFIKKEKEKSLDKSLGKKQKSGKIEEEKR